MKHAVSLLETEEMRVTDDDKKNDLLGPTDIGYDNDTVLSKKTSNFVPLKSARPSFNLIGMEENHSDINEDLNFLNVNRPSEFAGIFKSREAIEKESKWRGCHNSFVDYIDRLGSLMGDSF